MVARGTHRSYRDHLADIWVDLLDPDEKTVIETIGLELHDTALERLRAPADPDEEPRPKLESQDTYVFGVLTVPCLQKGRRMVLQEVDVIVTPEKLITVRKTPPGGTPFSCEHLERSLHAEATGPGLGLYLLVDEVAERFLDLVDTFDDDIDELEDHIGRWPSSQIRDHISQLRHDILRVRRSLAPTRDVARAVLDDRVDLDDEQLFPRDVELRFADAYDKLLRATDGLDLSRDLLAGVRDYHQAQVANDMNEVMKRLTVVASMVLLPTFIVGLYGQNLKGSPEFGWAHGYSFSWFLIVVTTIGQYVYFRRKGWIGSEKSQASDELAGAAGPDRSATGPADSADAAGAAYSAGSADPAGPVASKGS